MENELNFSDAQTLLENVFFAICEGSSIPLTADGARFFAENEILHAPGKVSNARGVAVSGLEQSQNSQRISWGREEVDKRLQGIMADIHQQCIQYGAQLGQVNYVAGANIGGFKRVADTMLAYGIV